MPQTQAPPAGFEPIAAPPAGFSPTNTPPPPEGFEPVATSSDSATPPAPGGGLMSNIVGGMIQSAAETAHGAASLAEKGANAIGGEDRKIVPAVETAPVRGYSVPLRTDTQGTAVGDQGSVGHMIGEGAEQVGEFAAGDAALEGAARFSKIAQRYPEVVQLIEKYPKAAKILLGTAKGATVGAAQGAVKGAAEGKAVEGAEGGAAGGAIGAGIGETAGEIASELGKTIGIGTSAESDITRGAKPAKRNYRFAEDFKRAAPYMDAENQANKAANVEDWADHTDAARQKLWAQQIQPIVDRHAGVPLSGISIRDSISKQITPEMKKFNPAGAAEVERLANEFMPGQTFQLNVGDAEGALEHFNAELAATGYWSKLPSERAALLRTDPKVLGYKASADAIRDELYNRISILEPADAPKIEELKKDYGALRNVGNEIRGQVNVAGRQNPISLKQMIGIIGGAAELAQGTPWGAAVAALPFVDRAVNSPENLIARGVQKAARPGEEGAVTKTVQATGKAVKGLAAPAGAAAGRLTFTASDGSVHSIPNDPESIKQAVKVDPNLTFTKQ